MFNHQPVVCLPTFSWLFVGFMVNVGRSQSNWIRITNWITGWRQLKYCFFSPRIPGKNSIQFDLRIFFIHGWEKKHQLDKNLPPPSVAKDRQDSPLNWTNQPTASGFHQGHFKHGCGAATNLQRWEENAECPSKWCDPCDRYIDLYIL